VVSHCEQNAEFSDFQNCVDEVRHIGILPQDKATTALTTEFENPMNLVHGGSPEGTQSIQAIPWQGKQCRRMSRHRSKAEDGAHFSDEVEE